MNKRFLTIGIVVMFMLFGISACSADKPRMAGLDSTKTEEIVCTEPRPEVCTMDYQPVCALLQDGNCKTFSNGCNACSDISVISYRYGTCE